MPARPKLSSEDAEAIRNRIPSSSFRKLAAEFKVSIGAIQKILSGATHKHVDSALIDSVENITSSVSLSDFLEAERSYSAGNDPVELAKKLNVNPSIAKYLFSNETCAGFYTKSNKRTKPTFPDSGLLDFDLRKAPLLNRDSIEEITLTNRVFDAYRTYGYPYRYWGNDQLVNLCNKVAALALPVTTSISAKSVTGIKTLNAFHPYMDHVNRKDCISPAHVFKDDDLFRKAILIQLRYGRRLSPSGIRSALTETSNSSQISNFRPVAACSIVKHFKAKRVLDICAGWGGRLLWAMSAGAEYVGIDPNRWSVIGNRLFINEMENSNNTRYSNTCDLINAAAEDVLSNGHQLLEKPFDIVLTSPPYFDLEEYSHDKNQSRVRYKDYGTWLREFLCRSIRLSSNYLTKEGLVLLNVAEGMKHDTIEMGKAAGLDYVNCIDIMLAGRRFAKAIDKHERGEPLLVFRKSNV